MSRTTDRGAVMILFVIFIGVIFLMAAFAVDLGNVRQEQRSVKTSTDATSLATIQAVDFNHPSVTDLTEDTPTRCDLIASTVPGLTAHDVAEDYLASNEPDAGLQAIDGCMFTRQGSRGYVTVRATSHVEYQFGPLVGLDGASTGGASTASISSARSGNLRPLVLCTGAAEFTSWLNAAPEDKDDPVKIRLDKPTGSCATPGNWGQLDFNNDNNGTKNLTGWIETGYPGPNTFAVSNGVDPCEMTGQNAECINGDTGNNFGPIDHKNPDKSSIFKIRGSTFWLPTTNFVTNPGGNAKYEVNGFAEVTLVEYCIDKNGGTGFCPDEEDVIDDEGEKQKVEVRYIEVVIHQWITSGPCCPESAVLPPSAARICAVDDDDAQISNNC